MQKSYVWFAATPPQCQAVGTHPQKTAAATDILPPLRAPCARPQEPALTQGILTTVLI